MKFWGLLILGAVFPFLLESSLPTYVALVLLFPTLLIALLLPKTRVYCLAPIFFVITTLQINERLADRLPQAESRTTVVVSGTVDSLPHRNEALTRFNFLIDKDFTGIPEKIRVTWYAEKNRFAEILQPVPNVRAGERWRLQLQLRPTRSFINFHGVDNERRYFTDGIGALATVQDGPNRRLSKPDWHNLQHLRENLLNKLEQTAGDKPSFRILAALAIADRRGLQSNDREILALTGTGHLLAISGLHIGLAAGMGFYLGRVILICLTVGFRQVCAIVVPWVTAWLAALSYSALSGFGVSTQRALIMLSVLTLVTLSRRQVHPFLGWLIAMALVLIFDPFAPLRAGFWLSFLAVAILMMLFAPRHGHYAGWQKMLLAQSGISLMMAPLGMYWFQQVSLPGLLANLIAIPVVSMAIVPLVLAGMLCLYAPLPLAAWLLTGASHLSEWLLQGLGLLASLQPGLLSSTYAPGLFATVLAMLGAAILFLPRGLPGRFAGGLLMLPLAFSAAPGIDADDSSVDFLDVGQGLAVLIKDHDYLMVYDTGPGNGLHGDRAWDMVESNILPMIKAAGQTPDLIVVSHADLDHAGGLQSLQSIYPEVPVLASLPAQKDGISRCRTGLAWETKSLTYSVLHPSDGLPYLGNDSSCVISVSGAALSLLLSGDISKVVEQRLVNEKLAAHDLLTVPHHGSSTSSSRMLIDTVNPKWALISAGADNRFSFPRQDVLNRFSEAQVTTLSTALCGGLRLTTQPDGGFTIESARVVRKRPWRWPAAESCP